MCTTVCVFCCLRFVITWVSGVFVGSMLVISLLLCFVFFVLFVFVLCLVDSASGLVLRFSLTFIQSPSIDLLVLLTRSLVAA
jgi:hypothetical protein